MATTTAKGGESFFHKTCSLTLQVAPLCLGLGPCLSWSQGWRLEWPPWVTWPPGAGEDAAPFRLHGLSAKTQRNFLEKTSLLSEGRVAAGENTHGRPLPPLLNASPHLRSHRPSVWGALPHHVAPGQLRADPPPVSW